MRVPTPQSDFGRGPGTPVQVLIDALGGNDKQSRIRRLLTRLRLVVDVFGIRREYNDNNNKVEG